MKPEQVIGVIGMSAMTIRPGDTSVAQGVNDLPVVGSNHIISLMESACSTAIIEFLDFGETTVTTNSVLEILGAAGIGTEIHATARCLGLTDNVLKFEVDMSGIVQNVFQLNLIADYLKSHDQYKALCLVVLDHRR